MYNVCTCVTMVSLFVWFMQEKCIGLHIRLEHRLTQDITSLSHTHTQHTLTHTQYTHYSPNLPNNIVALGDPGSVTQPSTILEIPTVDPQRPRQSMFALSYDELDSLVRDFFQSKNSDRSANNLTQAPLLNSLCMASVLWLCV